MLLYQIEVNCFILFSDSIVASFVEVIALHPGCWAWIEESEPKGGEQEYVDHNDS